MAATVISPISRHRSLPAILSAILASALYAVTLGGTYVYDDVHVVLQDPRLHDVRKWTTLWTGPYYEDAVDNLYRPLVSQSYALQWWLHGDRPWAFHLVNILLHAAAAALVAELARRLAGWRAGLIAGLIFAALPIHVEDVAELVGRADLASTAAIIGAIVLFLHRPMTVPRAVAIGALTIVAMLCKESGMLMPALLAAMAIAMRMGRSPPATDLQSTKRPPIALKWLTTIVARIYKLDVPGNASGVAMMWLIITVAWSVSGFIILREQILKLRFEWDKSFLDWTIQPMVRSHGLDRVKMPLLLLGRYMRLIVWPTHLSIDYGVAIINSHTTWTDAYVIFGIMTLLGWLVLLVMSIRQRWWAAIFCLLATAITYAMVSNVILIGTVFGERLMYLPSVFIIILTAIALSKLPRSILVPFMLLALGPASWRTVTYAQRWNDKDQFYRTSLAEQPQSVRLHLLVAQRAYSLGDYQTARQVMAESRAVEPTFWDNWLFSGVIEQQAGDYFLAEKYFRKAYECEANMRTAQALMEIQGRINAQSTTRPAR